jgi:putative ABC transport system substrate-binding protein
MRRREFIMLFGGAAVAWPLAVRAQHAGKIWRIGYMTHADVPCDALFEGLRQLGYVEGKNIIMERRYAEGRAERFKEFAAEIVRLKADLIITTTTPAALAAKNATTTIPIIIPIAIDPVATGLVASLAHPAGNVTGGAILTGEMATKQLGLFKELVSGLSRLAVLWNSANPANASMWRETQAAARRLGITVQSHEVRGTNDLERAFARIAEDHPDAVFVLEDNLTYHYRQEILDFINQKRLPSMLAGKDSVKAGGLLSYDPDYCELMRRAASQVDKILKGADPAELPMEQATRFELAINLRLAKALGLTVPPTLLSLADEVIE